MTPELQKIIDQMEPRFREAFLAALDRITSQAQLVLLEDAIRQGDMQKVIAVLNVDPTFFAPLDRAFAETHYQGGVAALAALGTLKDPFLVGVWLSALTLGTPEPKPSPGHTPET